MTAGVRLTDDDWTRLRRLLSQAAGLHFESSRRDSLGSCIAERLRQTGMPDVPAYLALLDAPGSAERQCLLDEVTIQETHFFRNPPQMQALRAHVLPELIRAAQSRGHRLRVWSAGCSTGEEPYTVAMVLRELLPAIGTWDVRVLATDVSQTALQAARRGAYGDRAVSLVSPEQRARCFAPGGGGAHQVRPEVRTLVQFAHHNLVGEPVPGRDFDLILCRNVTIYFDRATTRALMARLYAALRPGGYLLLGHAETLWRLNDDFALVAVGNGDSAAYVYRRPDVDILDRDRSVEAPVPVPRRSRSIAQRPGSGPGPGPSAVEGAAAVRLALAAGRYDEAAGLATAASVADPLRPESHYLLGRALVELGRDREALAALRRAVYLSPTAGLAHFLLAGALARSGDVAAAAREYRAAADTLGRSAADADAPELGGRSAQELAALCAQLASQLSAQSGQPDCAVRSGS